MWDNKVRVLHFSDLHIDITKYQFYKDILEFLESENFIKKVDFLVVSGDFGNKCNLDNCNKADTWIAEIKRILNLTDDQLIFCQGNHELILESLSVGHSEVGYNYENGRDYISNKGSYDAFDRYRETENKFPFTEDKYRIEKSRLGDYILEAENVRFVVLNSSWLSQINNQKRAEILKALNDVSEEKRIEETIRQFKGDLSIGRVDYNEVLSGNINEQKYIKDKYFTPTFNFKENRIQQLNNELKNKILEIPDDGKINLLVHHHPEFCLHFLEHFEIEDIHKSGFYSEIADKVDALLCGHIHPEVGFAIQKNYKTPHFIGAACHETKSENKEKDIFYYYEYSKVNSEFSYSRINYILTNGIIREYRTESSKIPTSKWKKNLTNIANVVSDSEELKTIIHNFIESYRFELESFLQTNFKGRYTIDEKPFYMPNIKEVVLNDKTKSIKPDYYTQTLIYNVTIDDTYTILIDFITSEYVIYLDYISDRKYYYSRDHLEERKNEKIIGKDIKEENCLYLPLIIDIFKESVASNSDWHIQSIENIIKETPFSKRSLEGSLLTFLNSKGLITSKLFSEKIFKLAQLNILDALLIQELKKGPIGFEKVDINIVMNTNQLKLSLIKLIEEYTEK